ncbi:phosphoenolpyruvate synthase, partial [bacterium]|nr:phosphoenolpyruvate synthase [bacterium]
EKIRADHDLADQLMQVSNRDCMDFLQAARPDIYKEAKAYIEAFGDRCTGELKLESVTLRQDPGFMFMVLKNFLKQPTLSADALSAKEKALRHRAETEIFKKVRKEKGLFALRRFKNALSRLRMAVKNRENMRLKRTHLFGLYRDIYLQIGRQMTILDLLNSPRDIFYLTCTEIKDYFSGTLVQHDLKALTMLRKTEYDTYTAIEPAHHFETKGLVYHHADYQYTGKKIQSDPNTPELRGIPCYPGRVTKRVKVIFDPAETADLNGDILCTVRTDPGWAPLFPSAGGILVERGSTLSHSAVVARELGIPAVVGIHGITKRLKTGDLITLDGETGIIEIHG